MARNALLAALQAGVLTPDDLTDLELDDLYGGRMPQPRNDIAPMAMNTMRVENGPDAGKVTDMNFRGQPGPTWQDLQGMVGGQRRQMRVVGAGNGSTVDLSPEDVSGPVEVDRSRAPVDVPGVGKAYYSKDGRGAYVLGPDGQPATKVLLGYDQQGSMDLNKWFQEQRAKEAQIGQTIAETAKTREATAGMRAQNNVREDPTTQPSLEKRYGKAEKGYQWTADGRLVPMPGGEVEQGAKTAAESAQSAIGHIDQMIGKRDADGNLIAGAKAHPGFETAVGMTGYEGGFGLAGLFPGTDTTNFKKRLEELKGGAFMQAFQSLKGGGQITEKEGEKATQAITRMDKSQSEAEFIQAALEFRGVLERGLAKAQQLGGKGGGSIERGSMSIPSGAISKLRANPGLAQDFDAKYGSGAAARVLSNG